MSVLVGPRPTDVITFQKAYLEVWEQEDDDQSHIQAEAPELQRLRGYQQLKTRVECRTRTNHQLLVAVPLCRNRHGNLLVIPMSQQSSGFAVSQKSVVFWEPLGAPLLPKNPCPQFCPSETVWHLSQTFISAVSRRGDLIWL